MSSVCITTPTATATKTIQTGGVVTSFSNVVRTLSASKSISVSSGCIGGSPSPSTNTSAGFAACQSTTVSYTITIPGDVVTTQVPYALTIDDIHTQLVTQYATICSVISGSASPAVQPSASNSSPSLAPPVVQPPATSSSPPPPALKPPSGAPVPRPTSSPTAVPTPYVTTIIEGSITRRSTVYPSGTVLAAQATETGSNSRKVSTGPIVGGVVGGLAVAAMIGFMVYYFFFKPGAGSKFGGRPNPAHRENYGNENIPINQTVQTQTTPKTSQCNAAGNNTTQYGTTGGEPEQRNPFESTQDTENQYHDPGRIPGHQQLQQFTGPTAGAAATTSLPNAQTAQLTGGSATSSAALGPFAGGYPAAGTYGVAGAGLAATNHPPVAYIRFRTPSPTPTAQTQYSQSSYNHGAGGPPTPLVPALPQTQGQPQMANYQSQLVTQYNGHAEPQRGM